MAANRFPADKVRRSILQYRKLAAQAKDNAGRAVDDGSRDWFLALAKTMTRLADALEKHHPT